jgi:hypothetical protein
MLTSTCRHRRLGQVARRLPAVRLKVEPSTCCCHIDDLDVIPLQPNVREPTVLVLSSRHKELRCSASRPYKAWSAILKYEKTPIKAASSGLGKVISRLLSWGGIHLYVVTLHQQGDHPKVMRDLGGPPTNPDSPAMLKPRQ